MNIGGKYSTKSPSNLFSNQILWLTWSGEHSVMQQNPVMPNDYPLLAVDKVVEIEYMRELLEIIDATRIHEETVECHSRKPTNCTYVFFAMQWFILQ